MQHQWSSATGCQHGECPGMMLSLEKGLAHPPALFPSGHAGDGTGLFDRPSTWPSLLLTTVS